MNIIAISGKGGVGKDYTFTHQFKKEGYLRVALADHFKIATVGQGLATREEVFVTKPPKVREALQRLGTEEGRDKFGPDIWCQTALAWMEHWEEIWGFDKFCLVDVRFRNEVDFIRQHGGRVLRIVAPTRSLGSSLEDKARVHVSETDLDKYNDFDQFLINEPQFNVAQQLREGLKYPDGDKDAVDQMRELEQMEVVFARRRLADRSRDEEQELYTDPYRRERSQRRGSL